MIQGALPNRTVLGSYELRSVLGQGGCGISYLAYDPQLEREIVVKEHFPLGLCVREPGGADVLPTDASAYSRSFNNFCREARILAGLNHPAVVKVHDIFQASGTVYMVMEYVEGETLTDWMATYVNAPEQVEGVLVRLLEALKYVHSNEVLHRDIKPGNIIVRENGTPVLIDFGAAMLGTPEITLTLIGSLGYAPPEQFLPHGEVGPWSDLYALAHTFLALIPAESLKRYRPAFAQSLVQAARPLIAERYADAAAWLADMRRKRTRSRWPLVIAAVFLPLAVVGALLYFYMRPEPSLDAAAAAPTVPVVQPMPQSVSFAPAAALPAPVVQPQPQSVSSAPSTLNFGAAALKTAPSEPNITTPIPTFTPFASPQDNDESTPAWAQKMKDAAAAASEYDRIQQEFERRAREGWKTPEELEQALDEIEAAFKCRQEALRVLQQGPIQ